MNLIHIVLPFTIQLIRRRTGNCNRRIVQNGLAWIITMSLHGNGIHIIRTVSRIQTLNDLIRQHTVFYPSKRILQVLICHILFRSKGVKSQIGENRPSSIEVGFIIMYRMCGIPQIFQNIGHTFTGSLLKNTLIRIFTWSKIVKTHTCNGLKFRICRTGSNRRNLVISGRILFHQLPEVRDWIFRNIQVIYQCWVKERLKLKEQNIRSLTILLGLWKIGLCLLDPVNLILRIISRLTDTCIKNSSRQTIRITIILISKRDIAKIIRQNPFFKSQLCHASKSHKTSNYQRNHIPVLNLLLILRSLDQ